MRHPCAELGGDHVWVATHRSRGALSELLAEIEDDHPLAGPHDRFQNVVVSGGDGKLWKVRGFFGLTKPSA